MASPTGVSLGFLFLILSLSYNSGLARNLVSDGIMLTENNELERRLGEESILDANEPMLPDDELTMVGGIGVPSPPEDASPGGEPTSFDGNQVACGRPSCVAPITGPNCQNNCPSCACGQTYPQPQPAYPQPQPAYPQPQPAYPQPQPQPAYPPQISPGCQPTYPTQPEPNYPQPVPAYPPWPEPAYPPQPEPAYPPQSQPAYPPPITGPRPTSQSPGSPTNEPNSLQQGEFGSPPSGPRLTSPSPGSPSTEPNSLQKGNITPPVCKDLGCNSPGGLITQSPMTAEDLQPIRGRQIETLDTSDGGSMNEPAPTSS